MKNKKTILLVTGITLTLIVILSLALLKLSHDKASKYDITFICDTNYLVDNITVSKNDTITKPEDPVKENHRFVGWYYNGELYDFNSKVTSDIKLEARWEKIQKVSGVKLNHSVMILYIGETSKLVATVLPENADNKNVTWKSTSPDIVSVDSKGNIKALKEGNATIVVTTEDGNYTAKVNILSRMSIVGDSPQADITNTSFKVQFKDDNSKTLYSTQTIKYGNKVVEPETPSKEGHTFLGWYNGKTKYSFDSKVKSNLTLTAKWEKNKYTITFVNYDGTVLETKTLEYGDIPTYTKELPVKPGDDQNSYEFTGWYPTITTVKGNTTYTATYNGNINIYQVVFVDIDGTTLSPTQNVAYGNKAIEPNEPTKEGHKFLGWYNTYSKFSFDSQVKSNLTLTVKWEKNKYTITFVNYDGTVLETKTLEYGSTPSYTGDEPTKAKDNQYTYTFDTWSPAITSVTKNVTYTATFKAELNVLEVKFVDTDGSIITTQSVTYGSKVSQPTHPTKEGYTFAGWFIGKAAYSFNKAVTTDLTLTASWNINKYPVYFHANNGTILQTQIVSHGDTPKYTGATPTKPDDNKGSYVFTGWYPIIGPITEKTSYTAQFDLVFDIETELTGVLNSIKIKQFKTTHNNNNVNVEFVSYGNTTPPYYFIDIFFEVADLFHALSSNKKYESVELYYSKPGDKNGLTIDLTDYDLTDTRFSSWYDNGPNDPVSNWLGYLAKGEPATSAAADAASDDLIGKTVKITYKLKNGYSFENGKDTMEFTLTFSNEK